MLHDHWLVNGNGMTSGLLEIDVRLKQFCGLSSGAGKAVQFAAFSHEIPCETTETGR